MQVFHPDLNMMHPDLRRLDLNLLLVFDALYRHRSVAAAAHELALSPSTLSHALARLRICDRRCPVRAPRQRDAADRARRRHRHLGRRRARRDVEGTCPRLRSRAKRPHVRVRGDRPAFTVLPAFLARIQQVAPRLRIRVVHSDRKISVDELAAGRIDFALGYHEESAADAPGSRTSTGSPTTTVVIASAAHPDVRRRLTLDQYLAARHVVVTPWNESRGVVDHVLDRLGLARQIAVRLPTVLAAPFVIAESALLMTVPKTAPRRRCGTRRRSASFRRRSRSRATP